MSNLAVPADGRAITRRVFALSWPAVAEQWLSMLVGLVTTYLVGHLGAAPLAAVGLSEQIMQIGIALFASIGVGSTVIVARHVGAGEYSQISRVIQQSFIAAAIIGLTSSLFVSIFAHSILALFRVGPEVVEVGGVYLRYAGSSLFLATMMFVGAAILRGAGDTRTPMLVMLVVNVTNVVLSVVLIYGAFGIPGLQVTGAGIATAIARDMGGIAMVVLVLRGRGRVKCNFLQNLSVDTKIIKRILNVGIPAGLESFLMSTAMLAFATVVGGLGTVSLAAYVMAIRIDGIRAMPSFGIGMATTTLVGQSLGAGRPDLARRSARTGVYYAVAIVTVIGIGLFILAEHIAAFFVSDPEVIIQTAMLTRILTFSAPALAITHVLSGGLRGAGDTRWVLVSMIGCLWAGRVFTGLLLSTVFGMGVAGACIAMVADLYVRAGLCWWRFDSGKWERIVV
ncbi:MAG: MATE family efflux transporter [Dehalococcoidia bacterium]|nr:MATE family efflux transporter [Dehalococcoidia bacterium]